MGKRINLKPFKEQIIHLYVEIGSNLKDIGNIFGVHGRTISSRLNEWGVKTHLHGANYHIRHNALDRIGPNEAYWLGMISADGSVDSRKNRQDRIALIMAEKESDAVFNFRNMFSPDQPVRGRLCTLSGYDKIYRQRRLTISSQSIVDSLSQLGITADKTHSVEPHQTMLNCVYFWRGVFDGDGSFSTNGEAFPRVCLLMGSEKMVVAARDFFQQFGIGTGNIGHRTFDNSNKNDIWTISFHGQDAVDAAMLLYGDGTEPLRTDWTYRKLHRARIMASMRPDLYERRTFYDVWEDHVNMLDFPYYRNGITERFEEQVVEDRETQEQFETEVI